MKTAKYFSATWCGPCKQFKPIMEELASEGYNIEFIDGDENREEAMKYNIRSVPTTIILEGEAFSYHESARIVGVRTKEEMIKELR
jgi:thiol-disulfide isomerase/thioredoxin|tara:strand:- start:291 stop:548 length:258 start_codon:yes stop_codon:yes gene_type:complete